jgi:serine protease Do
MVSAAPPATAVPTVPPGFADAAERIRSSVVQVCIGRRRRGSRTHHGSGIAWRRHPDGSILIVSNAHVADRMPIGVVGPDGTEYDAELIARDPVRDLALMRMGTAPPDLVPAKRATGAPLRAGTFVVAMGHPFGVRNAVSAGVVHAVGPLLAAVIGARQRAIEWVQADLRLGPGHSGGPLVNAAGDLVGLNTMVVGGLALAVPLVSIEAFAGR